MRSQWELLGFYCRKMGLRRQKHKVWETELVDKLILDLCFFLFKKCGPYHATGF